MIQFVITWKTLSLSLYLFEKEFYTVVIKKKDHKIFKSNKSDKNVDELKKKSSTLKSKSKEISEKLDSVKKDIHTHLATIPNIPENEVWVGNPAKKIR